MKLSVIVPCLNAGKTVAVQLEALCRQRWNDSWEVIVVDNGSTDGTQKIVAQYAERLPGLQLVQAARRGAAHARNVGARLAAGDALAFCDADDEVGAGWLEAIGTALLRHDFVASRMDVEKLNPPWLARRLHNVQGFELRRISYPPFLNHAGSSGLAIKKNVHQAVLGFDESLAQREDTDYCFRVQLHGVPLHFEPAALIHIRYRESANALFRQARRWAQFHALLYKRYGNGAPLDGAWRTYMRTWRDLLRCAPRLFNRETRPAWMKTLGTQVGLLQGSIKYGVPPICEQTPPLEMSAVPKLVIELTENLIESTLIKKPALAEESRRTDKAR